MISCLEFLQFAKNQEACRQKWLEEINHLQNELQSLNSVLELQVHHLKGLLKNEITVRTQLASDKEELVRLIDFLLFIDLITNVHLN